MAARRKPPAPWLKPAAHLVLSLPLLYILWKWGQTVLGDYGALGANPVQFTIRFLGDWALRALIAALGITPIAKITGWKPLMRIRRLTGLWAFSYVVLHVLSYFCMDRLFSFSALWEDVLKRVYITIGMAALLLLIPLAVTSTNGMVKRLGGRNWQRLHRAVYVIGILGVIHFEMMTRGERLQPWYHGAVLAFFLLYRLYDTIRTRQRRRLHARTQEA